MNRSDFTALLKRSHAAELELNSTKGHDYAGDQDALSNFKNAAKELNLTPEQVLWVYFYKHYTAIRTYCETGAVASEGIEGRIADARLYLALLGGLVEEKKKPKRTRRVKVTSSTADLTPSAPVVDPDSPNPKRPRRTLEQVKSDKEAKAAAKLAEADKSGTETAAS